MVRRMAEPVSDPRWGAEGLIFNLILALDSYLGRPRVDRLIGNRRQRNIERLGSRTGSTPVEGPVSGPLEEMTERDPELFRSQHLRRSRPVLLSGLLSDSNVLAEWTPGFFRDRYGDLTVTSVDGIDRSVSDLDAGTGVLQTEEIKWHEQLDRMESGGPDYLAFFSDVFEQDQELIDDVGLERLDPYIGHVYNRAPIPKLFIGGPGTSTQWHCAQLQNMFVQIQGEKRWLLASPRFTPCLDPRVSGLSAQYCHSMIDFRNPDVDRYPLYRRLSLYEVVLRPGDVLYIPPFWWHCVSNLSTTIGLALWWPNLIAAVRAHPTLAWLTFLSPQHLARMAYEKVTLRRQVGITSSTSTIFRKHQG